MVNVSEALDTGRREAVEQLVRRLAVEIDASESARDRLPLVRAFLAAVGQLEALDVQTRREARAEARSAGRGHSGGSVPLDDLVERRRKRHASVR